MYWPVNILRNLALDNSPTDMVFLTDVYCIDWLLIIDYLIGVLAGEHPAEPRPGQLSHRHGVPHRRVLYWLIIDYWLPDRCTGRWTSCGTSPWTTLPPTWCSSQTCTVLIDYWLLITCRCTGRWTSCEPRPGQLSDRHGVPHRRVLYWLIIDYWLLIGVLAGEHPAEPRPGQLSHRHGVPHRRVLYWLIIDYWLLIGVLAGEHPAEPRPGQLSHRHGVPHRRVLYWLIIDYWLLIGVLAGEHPAEPRPGQLSHRHGVPHRRVLYWLIIDYWSCGPRPGQLGVLARWTSCGETLPPMVFLTDVSHLRNLALDGHGVPHRRVLYWLIIDYWLLIGVLAGEHPTEPRPGQLSHRHGVPHRRVLYWLIIDYWLLIGVLAGEHPAEPRPGQLSHRHGVPHRRVLYWLIIDYW